ncbi:hypothetical protein [Nonomuraea candida]|uniref:hypothetical protein n=1 Tax=Nonomuraea candida TaxID=359159 RepID=UPI0006936F5F|nr:hypothetical protein [Nonomuraea candida]
MDPQDELDLPESRWSGLQPTAREPDRPDPSWNRFEGAKAEARWPRRLAPVLAVVLLAEMAYAVPAYAAPRTAPQVQKETPVKGTSVPVLPPMADPARKQAWTAPPRVAWPRKQKAELGVGASAKAVAGDFPVKLVPAKAASGKSAPEQTAAPVTVELYAYGGDYGARLGLVKLEECALKSATATAACRRHPDRRLHLELRHAHAALFGRRRAGAVAGLLLPEPGRPYRGHQQPGVLGR